MYFNVPRSIKSKKLDTIDLRIRYWNPSLQQLIISLAVSPTLSDGMPKNGTTKLVLRPISSIDPHRSPQNQSGCLATVFRRSRWVRPSSQPTQSTISPRHRSRTDWNSSVLHRVGCHRESGSFTSERRHPPCLQSIFRSRFRLATRPLGRNSCGNLPQSIRCNPRYHRVFRGGVDVVDRGVDWRRHPPPQTTRYRLRSVRTTEESHTAQSSQHQQLQPLWNACRSGWNSDKHVRAALARWLLYRMVLHS